MSCWCLIIEIQIQFIINSCLSCRHDSDQNLISADLYYLILCYVKMEKKRKKKEDRRLKCAAGRMFSVGSEPFSLARRLELTWAVLSSELFSFYLIFIILISCCYVLWLEQIDIPNQMIDVDSFLWWLSITNCAHSSSSLPGFPSPPTHTHPWPGPRHFLRSQFQWRLGLLGFFNIRSNQRGTPMTWTPFPSRLRM